MAGINAFTTVLNGHQTLQINETFGKMIRKMHSNTSVVPLYLRLINAQT